MVLAIAVTGLAWGAAGPTSASSRGAQSRRRGRSSSGPDKVLQIGWCSRRRNPRRHGIGFLASEPATSSPITTWCRRLPSNRIATSWSMCGRTAREGLELVAIDVLHDLAVVRIPATARPPSLACRRDAEGRPGLLPGNPLGIGLSIVEGTFNGTVEESFTELIHFTGPSTGMSGGPRSRRPGKCSGECGHPPEGQLVGYLVPAGFAQKLLRAAPPDGAGPGRTSVARSSAVVAAPGSAARSAALGRAAVQSLAHFVVPNRPAPFVRCWGAGERQARQQYEEDSIVCESQAGSTWAGYPGGAVRFEHTS